MSLTNMDIARIIIENTNSRSGVIMGVRSQRSTVDTLKKMIPNDLYNRWMRKTTNTIV